MILFNCQKCGCDTKTLVVSNGKLVCPDCKSGYNTSISVANSHQYSILGAAGKVSELQKKHINQRTLGSDGKTVVHKNNPSKRWDW